MPEAFELAGPADEPVELPDQHPVEVTFCDRGGEPVEAGPVDAALVGADVDVLEHFGDGPASSRGKGPAGCFLAGGGGLFAGDVEAEPGVDRHPRHVATMRLSGKWTKHAMV